MSIETDAANWFARMRGPDAHKAAGDFAGWYAAPENARAFDHLARTWDQSMFLANTSTGRARDLGAARAGGTRRAAIAAWSGVLLAAAFAAVVIPLIPSRPGKVAAVSTTQTATGPEGRRTIELADGSRVLLDRSSRLEIAFGQTERRLRLIAGRARFDVARDASRPFIVDAGTGSVVAHGTLFDVTLGPRRIEIVLLRGAVDVRDGKAGPTTAHMRHLAPGQKVVLLSGVLSAPVASTPADAQWLQVMLEFDATPLAEAVATFNRSGGRVVRLDPAVGSRLRLTGAFRRDDPEGFAAALAATFGLGVRRNPDASLTLVPGASPSPARKP